MKLYASVIIALSLVMGVSVIGPLAQEAEENLEYTWGTVAKVSEKEIVVKEQDYETDEEIEGVYKIDSMTQFENAASLADIAAGDDIEIDYLVTDGGNMARTVSVEKPSETAKDVMMEDESSAEDAEY